MKKAKVGTINFKFSKEQAKRKVRTNMTWKGIFELGLKAAENRGIGAKAEQNPKSRL